MCVKANKNFELGFELPINAFSMFDMFYIFSFFIVLVADSNLCIFYRATFGLDFYDFVVEIIK